MKRSAEAVRGGKDHSIVAKIGNAAECRKRIAAAIAKRAYQIYQRQGRRSGHDQENWRLAESEILQPVCCGMLESTDEVLVSLFCTAVDTKNLQEIEAVVEPHRLILVGTKRPDSESGKDATVYRVVPLKEEFEPSSVKLRQRGALLEIEIHKLKTHQTAASGQPATQADCCFPR